MSGTCQSVQESCSLFIEPKLASFLVLYTCHTFPKFLPRIIWYDYISYQENSRSIAGSLDADARNTTAVKTTGSTIL